MAGVIDLDQALIIQKITVIIKTKRVHLFIRYCSDVIVLSKIITFII